MAVKLRRQRVPAKRLRPTTKANSGNQLVVSRDEVASHRGGPRITGFVVDGLAQLLALLLRFDGPADAVMSRYFKDDHRIGARDRTLIAEGAYFALRHLSSLRWMMQSASPERAPRLAAIVVLGRQHGAASLDSRVVQNDERAVRSALGMDLSKAPAAVRGEVPAWLHQRLIVQYEDFELLEAAQILAAPLDLRVNALKADRREVLREFEAMDQRGIHATATRWSPDGIRLDSKIALMRWPMYQQGRIEIQDEGSQLIARLVAPKRGDMIVDFCAGAGGKTLALGSLMRSTGRLYAFDINARRLAGLGPRLKRSGLSNVHPAAIVSERDPRTKRLAGKIDRVLVDAPCSGTGTLRRNPDLKWRFDDTELDRLNSVQSELLRCAARLVRRGGRLVYATCSLLLQENQLIVESFLKANSEFRPVDASEILVAQGVSIEHSERFAPWFVMLPHLHGTDGFFGAVLERN